MKTLTLIVLSLSTSLLLASPKLTDLREKSKAIKPSKRTKVIQVWASWCQSCSRALKKAKSSARSSKVKLITVSVDEDREAARSYQLKHKKLFRGLKSYLDPEASQLSKLGMEGVPATIVLGPGKKKTILQGVPSKEKLESLLKREN